MKLSLFSLPQGRIILFISSTLCCLTFVYNIRSGDNIEIVLFSIFCLILCCYWHFTKFYIIVSKRKVYLSNELISINKECNEIVGIIYINGPVYQIEFTDSSKYLFLGSIAQSLYQASGRHESEIDRMMALIENECKS